MQKIKLYEIYGLFELKNFAEEKKYELEEYGTGQIGENIVVIRDNKKIQQWSFLKINEITAENQIYQCIYEA